MGEELTGVTLGGFGGRSPPFSPFFFFFNPPPPPRSLCLSGFLQWRSAVSHAAAVAAAAAVASEARTQLGVFQNKFPLQLLLITVIIVII